MVLASHTDKNDFKICVAALATRKTQSPEIISSSFTVPCIEVLYKSEYNYRKVYKFSLAIVQMINELLFPFTMFQTVS